MTRPEELRSDAPLRWSAGRGTDLWELFVACIDGDLGTVDRLVTADAGLVRAHFRYRKPLYFAVRENRIEVAAYLLDRDPDPIGLAVGESLVEICRDRGHGAMERLLEKKLLERYGISERGEPVAALIRAGDLDAMNRLLDLEPALLHAGDLRSNRPIHWAVMTRRLPFVDSLLARGADINVRRHDGGRPIHLTNGDYHFRGWRDVPKDWPCTPDDVYRHLVDRGAVVDLGMACATGDLARVRQLLDADPASVNRVSDYASYYVGCGAPLKNASGRGHLEVVKLLLERGADPNLPEEGIAPDGHACYAAAANGHRDIVRLLLAHGARPNVEVESSADTLSRVILNGDQELTDLLCTHGASRSVQLMAYYNDLRTAAAVFAASPELASDPEALANAAGEGNDGFVSLMLRYCPDLPARLSFPAWSVGAKSVELNRLLFRHGLNPNVPDWLGVTALHHLAAKGDVEKAALFLDHGADVRARDEDLCSTPLGWAAKHGRAAMVDLLLDRGAPVNDPGDPAWATPLAWATRRGHDGVARRLRERGALEI